MQTSKRPSWTQRFSPKQLLLPFLLTLVLTVLGSVATIMAQHPIATMATPFWEYYPSETFFYAELKAEPAFINGFFDTIETLSKSDAAEQGPQVSKQAVKAAPKTAKVAPKKGQVVKKTAGPQTPETGMTTPQLKALFNTYFEPEFSLGVWQSAPIQLPESASNGTLNSPATPKAALEKTLGQLEVFNFPARPGAGKSESGKSDIPITVLVGLKPKSDFDLQRFLKADVSRKHQYHVHDLGSYTQITYTDEQGKTIEPAIAYKPGLMLVADDVEALDKAFKSQTDRKTILDQTTVKDALALLPTERKGTIIVAPNNSSLFSPTMFAKVSFPENAPLDAQKLAHYQEQLFKALSVTVGTVDWSSSQLAMEFYTPMTLNKMDDSALRDTLMAYFMRQSTFEQADYLSPDTLIFTAITGMGSIYDLYTQHLASPSALTKIASAQKQLSAFRIDLRTQVVGLFDNVFGFAVRPNTFTSKGQDGWQVFMTYNKDISELLKQVNAMGEMPNMKESFVMNQEAFDPWRTLYTMKDKSKSFELATININKSDLMLGPSGRVRDALASEGDGTQQLSRLPLYKALMKDLPQQKNAVYFLNVAQIRTELSKIKVSPSDQPGYKAFLEVLKSVDGVGGASVVESDKLAKTYLRVQLAPTTGQPAEPKLTR